MTAPSNSDPAAALRISPVARPGVVLALAQRDFQILRSYRTAFLSDLVFGFLNLVVYYFISRVLKPGEHSDLQGAPSYFAFAAGGVVLSVVLQAGASGITRRVRDEQLTGTLEMLVIQPIRGQEIGLGLAGFPIMFALFRALTFLLLAAAFLGLDFDHTNWLGLVLALTAAGAAFTAIGIALAAIVVVFKRAEVLGAAAVLAMSLLGGAVFPTQALSSWLRPLSYLVPTRYAFEALRGAQFGVTGWVGPTLVLVGFTAVALPLALGLFTLALQLTVRRGSISRY